MVALIVAVAYLQGYWGYYDLLIFPYLSFNEMVAYAAAPLFGFLLALFGGMIFGALNAITKEQKRSSKFRDVVDVFLFGAVSVLLIYLNRSEKWLFVPLALIFLISIHLLDCEEIRARIKDSPKQFLTGLIIIYLVVGSFGYGRTKAQDLAQNKIPNVQATVDGSLVKTRLIGKISGYYFFLGMDGRVSQHPESTIKLIVYEKIY